MVPWATSHSVKHSMAEKRLFCCKPLHQPHKLGKRLSLDVINSIVAMFSGEKHVARQ